MKKKKPNIAKLKRKADKLWSEKIRSIGCCENCGSKEHLQSHHLITRRNTNLRWNLLNGVSLCPSCHLFSNNSFHHNPIIVMEFLKLKYPQRIEYLKEWSSKPMPKLEIENMEVIIKSLWTLKL